MADIIEALQQLDLSGLEILLIIVLVMLGQALWTLVRPLWARFIESLPLKAPAAAMPTTTATAPEDHPLMPKLDKIDSGLNELQRDVATINKTLNGNGDPRGGLVAMVQRHAAILELRKRGRD